MASMIHLRRSFRLLPFITAGLMIAGYMKIFAKTPSSDCFTCIARTTHAAAVVRDEPRDWVMEVCTPKRNIVFLKTHKTASSAVQNILLRYGVGKKLTFAMPGNAHDFNYPSPFRRSAVVPLPGNKRPDILCHHARFDRREMAQLMPPDQYVYVTIVREPLNLFRSSFAYFRPLVPAFRQTPANLTAEGWLDNAAHFVARSAHNKSSFAHLARSHMFFDLGYGVERSHDHAYVENAINELDAVFDLVMVADHFEESVILLSQLLCWPLEAVVCLSVNARHKPQGSAQEQADEMRVRARVREWNFADAQLFDHFNATLWRRVEVFGRQRMREQVSLLRDAISRMSEQCLEDAQPVDSSQIKDKRLQRAFYIPKGVKVAGYNLKEKSRANTTCRHLVSLENGFSREIFFAQNPRPPPKSKAVSDPVASSKAVSNPVAQQHHDLANQRRVSPSS